MDTILKQLGIPWSSYYRWAKKLRLNTLQDRRGCSPSLERVLAEEEQAVIKYALKHPQDGYRRLAWKMVDEDVVYLCPSSVYRILDKHDLLYRWKRSTTVGQKPKKPEAPDERWHSDILYLWVNDRWYFMVTVIDAYSRYIIHWRLLFTMRADDVVDVLEEALEKTPEANPQIVTDNGSQFIGKEFRQLVKRYTLTDIKTRKQHPESNGLIERYHRTLREEALRMAPPAGYYQATDLITRWVEFYNNQRLHSAIKYLRPVDYYRGNPDKLVKERLNKLTQAKMKRRLINQKRLKLAA